MNRNIESKVVDKTDYKTYKQCADAGIGSYCKETETQKYFQSLDQYDDEDIDKIDLNHINQNHFDTICHWSDKLFDQMDLSIPLDFTNLDPSVYYNPNQEHPQLSRCSDMKPLDNPKLRNLLEQTLRIIGKYVQCVRKLKSIKIGIKQRGILELINTYGTKSDVVLSISMDKLSDISKITLSGGIFNVIYKWLSN